MEDLKFLRTSLEDYKGDYDFLLKPPIEKLSVTGLLTITKRDSLDENN